VVQLTLKNKLKSLLMKRTIIGLSTVLAAMLLVVACKKNTTAVISTRGVEGQTLLKINYAMPYAQNRAVQIKINDERVSNNLTYNTPFPGGGLNTGGGSSADYMGIPAGSVKIGISIPKVGTEVDSIALYSGSVNLDANKFYTVHITDTGANATNFVSINDRSEVDSGFSRFTFINLMPNVPAIDLYFGTTKVASNIAYKAESAPFTVAASSPNAWAIRPAGAAATTTALASYSTGSVLNQRVFTVYARGYSGITSTSDVRRPQVSLLYNR